MQFIRIPGMKALLRRAFRSRAVAICPNAGWMQTELEKSFGDIATIQPVPFGIDPRWFEIDRGKSPAQPHEWLVVSRLTRAKLGPLLEWCAPLFARESRELHLIGPMQENIHLPDWVRYHGPASPEDLCNRWFPRATGLITLSRHAEGRPQVILEAMAAGLPIIASRLPAHEGLVHDKHTGYIVDNPEQLALSVQRAESHETTYRLGAQARKNVHETPGTWDDTAKHFCTIYRHLLEKSST
ncbi:glycosyltransferase family 4 protein [Oleiagrimonas sp. MCCC 1A03011]|uniref:glycosyltransferase family 4 protein n=1 Tax=Oleiagrimonas sp. MCCC 1A03011 TaxID=1926883 RepID=UPI001F0B7462|nr:glycosyltransferase family 4 protein [Oleiagrimonas sp. MCCC 1A03011]